VLSGELVAMIAVLLAAGLVAGVLAGLLGVGGGIVLVPVLEFAFGALGVPDAIRMHLAVGTSLASIIPTALSSARAHRARGAIDHELARHWLPAIALGSAIGALIASGVRGAVLSAVFGVVALTVAIRMMLGSGDGGRLLDVDPKHWKWMPVPALIGVVSAMMGIGGGTLSVPTLNALGLPVHRAVGTSAWFGLWIALPGAIGFALLGRGSVGLPPLSLGHVNLLALVVLLPATVLAAPAGAALAHRLSKRQLSVAFGLFLLVTGVRMLYRAWSA
jgi:uncharacterized membrane protein YfcA